MKSKNAKDPKSSRIIMIDFGITKRFLSDAGEHIECVKNKNFEGNFLFQSHNAFRNLTLTRRDDLISLAYILTFYFVGEVAWTSTLNYDRNLF